VNKEDLKEYLLVLGAVLVGFADLESINAASRNNMKYGIAFAVNIKPQVVQGIGEGPTKEYYDEYKRINETLDNIAILCVKYIESAGYNAIGQTSTFVTSDNNLSTALPHKTVATRAGLGWIGKNALLLTTEYGSAIRISSVLTDMPLIADNPINESKCGKCTKCVETCPAGAIKGTTWNMNSIREQLIDPFKCRKKARELLKERIGIESAICGKCIEVCPFTQRYIKGKSELL
jgi:epoxyqueuosine reductase QueG